MIEAMNMTMTQADFGELVGISQQAVSDLVARKVIAPEQSAGQWLLAYCGQLREAAAGRSADGALALERATQARVARERNEIQLAKDRREYAAVALIELFCAHVGRTVSGVLEPLPAEIHKLCPALTPDDVRRVQLAVAKACDQAVSVTLADFENADDDSEASSASDVSGLDPD